MFGYIVCKKSELTKEECARYQGLYCGLCRSLQRQFGQSERLSVNYDMTFLAMLLSSLYEPEEQEQSFRCGLHITEKRTEVQNEWIDYAACMTIAMAYHKCLDDWKDEGKRYKLQYAKRLSGAYQQISARFPKQCEAIELSLRELELIEGNPDYLPDEAINCSGRLVAELFAPRDDFWSSSLRQIGYNLGRFVYLMDAAMDYDKDKKTGNYNPILRMNKTPKDMEVYLNMLMGNAVSEVDKLPILQDESILNNILYEGVWQKYSARYYKKNPDKKEEKKSEKKAAARAGVNAEKKPRKNKESLTERKPERKAEAGTDKKEDKTAGKKKSSRKWAVIRK